MASATRVEFKEATWVSYSTRKPVNTKKQAYLSQIFVTVTAKTSATDIIALVILQHEAR